MLYAIVAVIILILDQAMKYWVTRNIPLDAAGGELIPGLVGLTKSHNYGAAFSILQNARVLFIVLTVVFIIIAVSLLFLNVIRGGAGRWSLVAVLSGAIGNGIDRAIQGYVVDMFRFEFIRFPIFNVADIFITLGGISFCLYVILHKDPWLKNANSENAKKVLAPRDKTRISPPHADAGVYSPPPAEADEDPFSDPRAGGRQKAGGGPAPGKMPVRDNSRAPGGRNTEYDDEPAKSYSVDDILAELRAGEDNWNT